MCIRDRDIEREFGIPIINKRISVTPISLVAGGSDLTSYVPIAEAMDRAAKTVGVNFIGGYSALVTKGATRADRILIDSIPEALATTDIVCSSVGVGSTKTGINMDAVRDMGIIVKKTAELTKDNDALGCAKLVIFCNPVEDNPFMAGAFFGVTEGDSAISVGVSGPGVVKHALESVRGQSFDVVAETIKRTAFKITRVGPVSYTHLDVYKRQLLTMSEVGLESALYVGSSSDWVTYDGFPLKTGVETLR